MYRHAAAVNLSLLLMHFPYTPLNFELESFSSHLTCYARCNKVGVAGLPARFLDVTDPSRPGVIMVVNTEGIDANYIALSHTWGNNPPFTMTLATLDKRMDHIAFWELPATFQDAVTITRHLGCRYLWIDSLCIVQDSVEDWQQESAKMRHVYRGSLVTISALSATSSKAGIWAHGLPKRLLSWPQRNLRAAVLSSLRPIPSHGTSYLDGPF